MLGLRLKWVLYYCYTTLIAVAAALLIGLILLPASLTNQISTALGIHIILAGLSISLVVGVVAGFQFSGNVRKRFEEIGIGARSLAYGDLQYRLPFIDDPEVGDIAIAFNDMAERLEKQVVALQQLAEENESLIQQTKLTAVSEERQRLARDLHDAVSQQLFAISMMAATATKLVSDDSGKLADLTVSIEQSAAKAQAEMRALLLQLRPITLQGERLIDAISSLAQELQRKQVMDCDINLADVNLPKNIENQLYRITQEGLSNILRHAEADKVLIKLSRSDDKKRLLLVIEDNGKGFAEKDISKTSMGIKSIRERVASLGGTAQWISVPNQGTKLEVRVPLTSVKE